MPFVTRLTLESGDRDRLDGIVDDIKRQASRKGVELNGPHHRPPEHLRVPQSKTLGADDGRFESWGYTVYSREIEIVGYEEFARSVAGRSYPPGIRVVAEVEQRTHVGGS